VTTEDKRRIVMIVLILVLSFFLGISLAVLDWPKRVTNLILSIWFFQASWSLTYYTSEWIIRIIDKQH
jgi:hypothetical protein